MSVWNSGRAIAETELNKTKHKGQKCDYAKLASEGKTLIKPFNGKTTIGLHEVEIDFSMDMDGEVDSNEMDVTCENERFFDVIEQPNGHDTQIQSDNKYVYKASVLRSLFSADKMWKDHLRRVQGMTRSNTVSATDDLRIDKLIMIGDPILVSTESDLKIATIMGMAQGGKKERYQLKDYLMKMLL